MFKLYLADVNYNIIAPIDLNTGGVRSLTMIYKTNQARELKAQFTTYLDQYYDYLSQPETRLVLEIDGRKIGFSKDTNLTTHLLAYAEIGSGSDFRSVVKLDNTVLTDNKYTISNQSLSDGTSRASYLTYSNNYQRQYYRVKVFNFSNLSELGLTNLKQAQKRLYNEAVNYLKANEGKASIEGQIKRQNGLLDLTFYSSSYDLASSRRTLTANQEYSGRLSNLLSQIDPSVQFELLTDDITIELNTGMYNNFELLNEIVKNRNIGWREVGLTQVNGSSITKIQVGDFDKLAPLHLASNLKIDDVFDESALRIAKVTEFYPTLQVELETTQFIQEGDNIMVVYKEYHDNIDGTKTKIFDIQKVQNFQGGTLQLYNVL